MKSLILQNAKAVLHGNISDVSILIENGIIQEISETDIAADENIDLNGAKVFAGFIDIHNHGAIGFDVNESAKNDFIEVGKFLAKNGITAWLPTFVPDSDENYRKIVNEINEVIKIQDKLPIAQIVGVHYEGIFANKQMCGALRPEFFKIFDNKNRLSELPKLENGVHLTTFAPEIEGGIELTEELVRQNWIPSIGHTKADIETLEKARIAGAKHLTHFFNAMTGVHHREIGVAGWGLTTENVTFDIIGDMIHVAPEMLKFAIESKLPEKVLLISDSVAPTGLGDGNFELWGENISVIEGKTRNERGSIAGSVITILDAVRNLLKLGFAETEISRMASANPAKLLGIDHIRGSIEVGKRADLVVIDKNANVTQTFIGGRIV